MQKKSSPQIIVRVSRPELTPEEHTARMAEIKRAATDLIVAAMKNSSQPAAV